jgi:hypothetical protein
VGIVFSLGVNESMKIYVASSWRNALQPGIVHILRRAGHDVYDFRHPEPGNDGFAWSSIDECWQDWTSEQYRTALQHPIAVKGYQLDIDALRSCEVVVYVLPCGRSASWEFGYAMGQGKKGYVIAFDRCEPELMFREATILTSMNEVFDVFLSKEKEAEIRDEKWFPPREAPLFGVK